MNLFTKYPWLQSMAWSDFGDPLVNGFHFHELLNHRELVNWTRFSAGVFIEAKRELEARGILLPGFVVWRDGMASR